MIACFQQREGVFFTFGDDEPLDVFLGGDQQGVDAVNVVRGAWSGG